MEKPSASKAVDPPPRVCPSSCGFMISGRDSHSFCISCLGVQHAQSGLSTPEGCAHCAKFPERTLRRRLRVAASSDLDPKLSDSQGHDAAGALDVGPAQNSAGVEWGDMVSNETDFPPLFGQEFLAKERDELNVDDDEDDSASELLAHHASSDDEDAILPATQPRATPTPSGEASIGGTPAPPSLVNLYDVYKRAADRLGIPWPASQDTDGATRDIYDGKRLPPHQAPTKQFLPMVPACLKNMKLYWDKPFSHRVPVMGYSGLDVQNMEELGLAGPPPVEPSVAYHLHPNQRSAMASATPSLPGKIERFSASIYQKIYRSSAQAVRALNVTTMLMAYQAEILEEMGRQLDSGAPSPGLWEEICHLTDLSLRTCRGGVQGCGRSMGLAVAGERALWLNLSSLPDRDKTAILDAPVDPKGLFGPALATMQERCDDKKSKNEAFGLCLPRKVVPRAPPPRRPGPASGNPRPSYRGPRPQTTNASVQGNAQQPPPNPRPNSRPWPKQSFAAVAARNRPSNAQEAKRKRQT